MTRSEKTDYILSESDSWPDPKPIRNDPDWPDPFGALGPIGSIERIKRTRHPAINRQKGKWEIEEIFEYNLDDPSFYQEL